MIRGEIGGLLAAAMQRLRADGTIPLEVGDDLAVELERPARKEHGDFSSNVALALARRVGFSPRELAQLLVERLPETEWVARVEVAGPGFINFFLSHGWMHQTIVDIAALQGDYGRSDLGGGTPVQVEYVSANPVGPLHVGSGRNAAFGDAVAALLERTGHAVEREYYINDVGRQVDLFARSLEARYLQALDREAEMPDDGYRGSYLVALGRELAEREGAGLAGRPDEIRAWGLARMLDAIRATMERFGVTFDRWFSEWELHESGRVAAAIGRLREAGHTFDREGALWFRSTSFGDTRDRVLVRSKGEPTYLASDIAYLMDKADRGFEQAIYVWGADHHGAVASLLAAARALDLKIEVEVLLYQLVNLFAGGEPVRMSKRTGDIITLDELMDEVGRDAARFTFLTRSIDSPLDFDLDLAKAQSLENPVYYVQYAHARICSILRFGREQGIELARIDDVELAELVHQSEHELIRKLAELPETIQIAAKLRAPHRLTVYAQEVAALFHAFYRDCRVISEDTQLTRARLWLAEATRQVLANALSVMGVGAPERM